jgi:hypothetical protein
VSVPESVKRAAVRMTIANRVYPKAVAKPQKRRILRQDKARRLRYRLQGL